MFISDIGPINEQQRFTVTATGGTYELIFDGETTAPIAWNAQEDEVAEALENLANIEAGDLTVTHSGQTYIVTYAGSLQHTNLPELTGDSSGLTGGAVTHIETIVDGTNAPPSVKEYGPNGVLLQTISCSACPGGPFTTAPIGVALDAGDNLYVGDAGGERVIEFHATPSSPATDYSTSAPTELSTGNMRSFTVNPANGEIWVLGDDGEGTHIKGFEPNGTKFADFGETGPDRLRSSTSSARRKSPSTVRRAPSTSATSSPIRERARRTAGRTACGDRRIQSGASAHDPSGCRRPSKRRDTRR